MNYSIEQLCRKDIIKIEPYQSARMIGGTGSIWLNANELPIVYQFNLNDISLNRYPECQPYELILSYALYSETPESNILVSRGADEGIELLMRVFCNPSDCIMTFSPTYAMYSKLSEIYGIRSIIIPMIDNFILDMKLIKLNINKVKLIYICRPNNPTGHTLSVIDIIEILNLTHNRAIVVIDEAYIDFNIKNNLSYLLCQYSNLVILRTLSKAFGLAGIRCGFILAHNSIIQLLRKVIAPYPLPKPSIDIAIQALSKDSIVRIQKYIIELNKNKNWLFNCLKDIDYVEHIFNSDGNFLLVKFVNFQYVFDFLWKKGIILRNQSFLIGLKGYIRITVGTKQECRILINELKNISFNY